MSLLDITAVTGRKSRTWCLNWWAASRFPNRGTNGNHAQSRFNHCSSVLLCVQHCTVDCLNTRLPASDSLSVHSHYVLSSLERVYKKQNRPEDALSQCESSLRLLADSGQPEKTCSVYRDMAAIEQDRGRVDRAIEHLSKARATQSLQHNIAL